MSDVKKNILIVHNYYQIPGGEDTVVANEKKMLEKHGHKVILYSRSNAELKLMSKFQKVLLPITTVFNPRTYRDIKKLIKKECIEVVHVHNTLSLISPAVYYAARSMKVPVVQTVHNFRLLCPGATFYRDGHICEDCVKHGLKCAIKHSCYRGSKAQTLVCVISTWLHRITGIYGKINYICLTEFCKKKLLECRQIKESQVFIKPNFTQDVREEQGNFYLFFGRIEEIKGLSVLIDAFKMMPMKRLKVVGTGSCLCKYKAQEFTNIEFLGYLERPMIQHLLRNALAVIVPSQWYETFGMCVIEAFACHVPVIAGNIGNVGTLIDNRINGVKFQYDSPGSLIKAVEEFESLDGPVVRENAYEKFKKQFSEEKNYEMLYSIYCKIREVH